MPNYTRAFVPGGTFFFTVAILERHRSLLTEHINELRQAFISVRHAKPFTLDAVVILPDHLHCLWTLPPDDADFSSRWHDIKAHFARSVPHGELLSDRRQKKGERGIWQRRFWEHVIRNEQDFERHADYIHFNPVKHGHAQRAADWPFSSFGEYVKRGIYAPDWGAGEEVCAMSLE